MSQLQKRQSDMTFQMKVLLYKNADFHRGHVQEDKLASAEQKTNEFLRLPNPDGGIFNFQCFQYVRILYVFFGCF
jgi:hypothetical protein